MQEEQINKNTFVFDGAQSGDLEGMAPNRNSVVRTSAYGADKASDLSNSEVVQEYPQVACLQTPCVLDGERVIALVDSGATDWLLLPDSLLLSGNGYVGTADATGLDVWENAGGDWPENATPILAGNRLWLYNRDGLYQFDLETRTAALQYPLPRSLTSLGDIIGLSDGGILLAHADTADRRLLAFNADGSLRWERSYEDFISGSIRLIGLNGRVYLTNIDNRTQNNTFSIYAVDLTNAALSQIFIGGSRSGSLGETWVETAEDRLIINLDGGAMLALDPLKVNQ
jgi:hypothetical protein